MVEAPQSYIELQQRLQSEHAGLSRRLKQIGEYAMRHPNDMALETIAEIAERAEVTPSSLVRFAQALGYDGFSQMQKVFREGLMENIPDYQSRLRLRRSASSASAQEQEREDGLAEFIAGAEEGLQALKNSVDDATLQRAVTLLASATRIHVLAQRRAFPAASYLAYAFTHLNRPAHLLDGIGGLLQEQEKTVLVDDVLVAVSFTPYAQEVKEVVESVHQRGARVLAITDSVLSPLAKHADVVLQVRETEVLGFRTLSSTMCLALALVVELGKRLD